MSISTRSLNHLPLPRGGVLVRTSAGSIQFGVPPETIKDTMPRKGGVPTTFVLTRRLFDVERGVSLAELEFPIYYNFFVERRRIRVVCADEQRAVVTSLIRETLFPAAPPGLSDEFSRGASDPALPDMERELGHFQRHPFLAGRALTLEDLIEFHDIPSAGAVILDGVSIQLDRWAGTFTVTDRGRAIAELPWDLRIPPPLERPEAAGPYQPPVFGVTALGTGSGFDPTSATSGFIVWCNRRGVMVDPPVDATLELRHERVHPKLVQDVILTHYHADHDSGLLQKVLDEGIIRLYTTRSIMEGFLRKAVILTGLSDGDLRHMIEFHPVTIGERFHILGAVFRFWYTLHSIPTVGFEAALGGRRIVYSSDHLNVPEVHEQLHADGLLSAGRLADLRAFPWDADLIIHEAGVPPLHTPPAALAERPDDVKRRLYLVHTVEERVAEHPGLKMMGHGIASTLELPVGEDARSLSYQTLKAVASVDFLRDLPMERAAEFLFMAERRALPEGAHLIHRGDRGEEMYVILHGEVAVIRDGRVYKAYGPGDFVGDMALVSDEPRFADVVTRSPLSYLAVSKPDVLCFLHRTGVLEHLRHLAAIRKEDSWPVLENNPLLDFLTANQLTQLQALLRREEFAPGAPVEHRIRPYAYLLLSGKVEVTRADRRRHVLGTGSLVGVLADGGSDDDADAAHALTSVVAYHAGGPRLRRFLRGNPGAKLRLIHRARYDEQARRFEGS